MYTNGLSCWQELFVTGAWDDKIKLWSLMDEMSRMTYQEHQYCIYSTIWSPNNESVFASASGDYTVKIWDINGEIFVFLSRVN